MRDKRSFLLKYTLFQLSPLFPKALSLKNRFFSCEPLSHLSNFLKLVFQKDIALLIIDIFAHDEQKNAANNAR